jgi:hypothetical protein
MRILPLDRLFRPATSHVYPPFKQGRYLEEFVYQYVLENHLRMETSWVYLPVFWTNLQNHPAFSSRRARYQLVLDRMVRTLPSGTQFVTVVQHDDGPMLDLPPGTVVYGCCTGHRPLPFIYEDTSLRLLRAPRIPHGEREWLMSFVGTTGTHPLRTRLRQAVEGRAGVYWSSRGAWSASVAESDASQFVSVTSRSRFCLAPRGYGRSSFRFFEAMLLDTVPVYFWDDIEWLPYRECIDYRSFSVSISKKEIGKTYEILSGISEEKYAKMVKRLQEVRPWFTLEGMVDYIVKHIQVTV